MKRRAPGRAGEVVRPAARPAPAERPTGNLRAPVMLACLALLLAVPPAAAQYIAVFVDGRLLHVTAARLLDERQMRLELPGGGRMDVPVNRIDHVIEDVVEPEPVPVPTPLPECAAAFADQALPAGTPFAAEIVTASRRADLHPWLVAAVVEAESRFNPWAVSRVGARGLMQLMPAVWVEQRISDPHDARANLAAGCRHLSALRARFGDLTLALAAYNAGAAVVEASHGMPPYRETRQFVAAVLAKFCPRHGVASPEPEAPDPPRARGSRPAPSPRTK